MRNILLVTSSPRGENSLSSRIARELADHLGGNLSVRELWREPATPITPGYVHASFTPDEYLTEEQRQLLEPSRIAIQELFEADTVIVAASMINFSIPATLKTWIDHITRAGKTFRYGEVGPEGLVIGKKVVLVIATGGVYSQPTMKAMDHVEPVLRTQLGFLGMTEVQALRIEGTMQGKDAEANALSRAREEARLLARSLTDLREVAR